MFFLNYTTKKEKSSFFLNIDDIYIFFFYLFIFIKQIFVGTVFFFFFLKIPIYILYFFFFVYLIYCDLTKLFYFCTLFMTYVWWWVDVNEYIYLETLVFPYIYRRRNIYLLKIPLLYQYNNKEKHRYILIILKYFKIWNLILYKLTVLYIIILVENERTVFKTIWIWF